MGLNKQSKAKFWSLWHSDAVSKKITWTAVASRYFHEEIPIRFLLRSTRYSGKSILIQNRVSTLIHFIVRLFGWVNWFIYKLGRKWCLQLSMELVSDLVRIYVSHSYFPLWSNWYIVILLKKKFPVGFGVGCGFGVGWGFGGLCLFLLIFNMGNNVKSRSCLSSFWLILTFNLYLIIHLISE